MNAPSPQRRRFFRWQFSLRGILLVMFLFGAGLTIYRWPWEETTPDPEKLAEPATIVRKTVTTWRRGWFGGRVKDGPERKYLNADLVDEEFYREGQLHGRCRSFYWGDRLTEERNFRGGVLHGPYRIGDGQEWVYEGQYFRGKRDGSWRLLTGPDGREQEQFALADYGIYTSGEEPRHRLEVPPDPIEIRQQWRRGQRHGHWEWRTLSGELINSAEYADNQLTRWNGEDAPAQFWKRVRELLQERDPVLFDLLKQPAGHLTPIVELGRVRRRVTAIDYRRVRRLIGEIDYVVSSPGPSGGQPSEERIIHFAAPPTMNPLQQTENSIGSNLLEFALQEGLAVEYRFGGLWFVPADEAIGFRDAPGADRIQFPTGSPQEKSWAKVIAFHPEEKLGVSSLEKMLIVCPFGASYDVRDVSLYDAGVVETDRLPSWRARRDATALVLYRLKLSCELRGNNLEIKPHWTKKLIETNQRPKDSQ